MTTDHQDRVRFWTRRFAIPIGSAVIAGLLMIGAFLHLFHRIPVPQFPAAGFNLQAAGLGNRSYLFLTRRDPSAAPSQESWWMKTVEDDRMQGESEVKPFQSLVAFSDKLWFFSPGMYRVFDGKEWQRFDAPWVGDDPIVTAGPERLLLLSRIGTDFSMTSYAHDVWERPVPVGIDPNDRNLLCSERCFSRLVIFKDKVYYLWLKSGTLYWLTWDGGASGRVESLEQTFGKLIRFEVLSAPDGIFIWYIPMLETDSANAGPTVPPIGLNVWDGNGWHGANHLGRSTPGQLLEISAFLAHGEPHLVVNTGIQIEDMMWEGGRPGRTAILMGGDLGPTVLRYQGKVLFLFLFLMSLATAGLAFALSRWKPVSVNSGPSYASVGRRLVAKAIDTAMVIIPVGILVGTRLDPDRFLSPTSFKHWLSAGATAWIIASLLLFTYHAVAEGFWGQTFGKRLCGIAVTGQNLKPCTILQSAVRNFLRLADSVCFYWVGLISIAATDRWQRLGDLAGRTIVVRTKHKPDVTEAGAQ